MRGALTQSERARELPERTVREPGEALILYQCGGVEEARVREPRGDAREQSTTIVLSGEAAIMHARTHSRR